MADDCMARRIKHHMEHIGEHPGGREQAIAIAAHECGVAKNAAAYDKEACFERQTPVGTFDANTKIKIKGGNYKATDTGDGYFTVHDVPLMSEVPQGTKGAPYAVTKEVLEEFVSTAQNRYHGGHFCATAYVGHNPDVPINHPDFAGYVLPNRVGLYKMESGDKWTAFGDIKIDAEKFSAAKAGKLPYTSPEVPWIKRRIAGLAFLDTLPPFYEYALFTIGEVVADDSAKFEAKLDEEAKFMDDKEKKKDDGDKDMDDKIEKMMAKHVAKYMDEELPKHLAKAMAKMSSIDKKPDALPVETNTSKEGAKMNVDPEFAAKFAALQNDAAELKKWKEDQENGDKAKKLIAKAENILSRKVLSTPLLEQIGQFAREAVTKKDGETWFDKFVETLKTSLREKPPSSMAEFTATGLPATDPGDPIISKFAQEGPDAIEQVSKFSSQWRQIKSSLGDRYTCTQENFITNELNLWKAQRSGELNGTRR